MSKRDTIDVKHVCEPEDSLYDKIVLILNGEDVPGTFCPISFIGTLEFKETTFDLLTCTCGDSGCAGIFEGTKTKNDGHVVHWEDIDCGFPKKITVFL